MPETEMKVQRLGRDYARDIYGPDLRTPLVSRIAVANTHNRGFGVFAQHAIEPGTTIFHGTSLYFLPDFEPENQECEGAWSVALEHQIDHLNEIVLKMDDDSRNRFASLAPAPFDKWARMRQFQPTEKREEDLAYTYYQRRHDNNAMHRSLWPVLSRVNHSCEPNCSYRALRANGEIFALELMADHLIAANEELTVEYVTDVGHTDNLFFDHCTCTKCVRESKPRIVSPKPGGGTDRKMFNSQTRLDDDDECFEPDSFVRRLQDLPQPPRTLSKRHSAWWNAGGSEADSKEAADSKEGSLNSPEGPPTKKRAKRRKKKKKGKNISGR